MPARTHPGDPNGAVYAIWRTESARLVAALTRMTRDVSLAEDLAQDALVAALEQWPETGVPDNPIAWLMTVAKRRAIDHFRRTETMRRKVAELGDASDRQAAAVPDVESQVDYIEDDVLRLVFLSCNPVLTPESRAALTLRLVGGLTTAEIARGFLVTESTMGQRISRAKKTLSEAHAEFELPVGAERTERLDDVMAVIYLIFNEGYTATTGEDWMRLDLVDEAIRLARMLVDLAPDEPEVLALEALLEIQGSRMAARLDEHGIPVLLEEQDRSLWDQVRVRRGLAALGRAEELAATGASVGRYFLQALIAVQHRARSAQRRRTGTGSRLSTTSCPAPRPDRSLRSIGPSPTVGRSVPTPVSPSWKRYATTRSASHPWCRACVETCSSGLVGTIRQWPRSPRRRHVRRMQVNAPYWGAGRTRTGRPPSTAPPRGVEAWIDARA